MSAFREALQRQLADIAGQGLYRELRRVDSPQTTRIQWQGKTFLNFSSNDYLGLANEPFVREAATKAIETYGVGSGASRLICGSLAPHHRLEETLAEWKNCEAALVFNSGYAAAVGTICALLGKDDIIVLDKLVHASIVDAARLSGAKLRVFGHNDLGDLEDILKWANRNDDAATSAKRRVLVVTESVFSMDGDVAPLREMVALKNRYGAWLMVDEAHATGLFGPRRCGLAEEMGVSDQIEIQMGTLGKAVGASGGYICGARVLIDVLINRARSFIFSTAPIAAAAAAANSGIQLIRSAEGERRRASLFSGLERLVKGLHLSTASSSAIIPILLGDEGAATQAATTLRETGIFVPAIRYPTVARGEARLRVTLTALHTNHDVDTLICALRPILQRGSSNA